MSTMVSCGHHPVVLSHDIKTRSQIVWYQSQFETEAKISLFENATFHVNVPKFGSRESGSTTIDRLR